MPDAAILIVEDDPGAVEAFAYMLKDAGYAVRVAPDAHAAITEVARERPAAIILDLHLPITSGLEVLRQLRATAPEAHIPVAVVTADYLVDSQVEREIRAMGAQLYFKPLWEEDLLRLVRALVSGT